MDIKTIIATIQRFLMPASLIASMTSNKYDDLAVAILSSVANNEEVIALLLAMPEVQAALAKTKGVSAPAPLAGQS